MIRRNRISSSHAGLLLVASLAGCGVRATPRQDGAPVRVAAVERRDVPLLVEATGTVEPVRTVAIQAQISGILTHIGFTEGQPVRAGQVLFELDPRPLQAALARAEAVLARDAAQAETVLPNAERFEALAQRDIVSQQQLEEARTSRATLLATLRADSAAVEEARLNLRYATVRAPLSGRAGAIRLQEGNLVTAGGSAPLVVINQIRPIRVRFPVTASLFDAVRRRADSALVVTVTPLSDSTGSVPEEGTLVFFDNAVDPLTNTVTLKAEFANEGGVLWPGALVRVALHLDVEEDVLVVPRAAVEQSQTGPVIWVIDLADTARLRAVAVGHTNDSLAVITRGVEEGERVVLDGQLRLVDGAHVQVRNEDRPE